MSCDIALAFALPLQLHVSYSHQLQLTEMQLRLAAELHRPVSLHCVRAYGHLRDMFDRWVAICRLGKLGSGACWMSQSCSAHCV